jgi:hypothetical protein
MSISYGGHGAKRAGLRQSRTSQLGHRATVSRVVRRDRILFLGLLPSTQLRQPAPAPAAAPLMVDRGHGPTVVAAHGRRERSDVGHRGIAARGNAADKCSEETFCEALTAAITPTAPHC